MYNDWLYFFNSPQTEIDVKNKKEKQQVTKEWTDDGGIKISGTKPSKWSIVLQPALSTDIYTLQYKLKNDKLEAVELFKRAFKYQDNNLFVESEKQYNELKKVQLDIKDIVSNNNKILKNVKEKIFQIRRDIYITNLEKPLDTNKIKRLTNELEIANIEQINTEKNIDKQQDNYILKTQSMIRNGPVPDPPNIKSLSLTTKEKKYNFEKNMEKVAKKKNNILIQPKKNMQVETISGKKKGGYIKVIKLL